MIKFRDALNEKGQDLLEFALILAFCAALVYGLNSVGFKEAIGDIVQTYVSDNVTRVYGLGTSYTEALNKWGQASDEEVLAAPQEERLAADQAALLNIANHLIGMTKSELKTAINVTNIDDKDKIDNVFITKFLEDPDGTGTYAPKMKVDKSSGNLIPTNGIEEDKTGGKIFNWLQGDLKDDVNIVFEDRNISFLVDEKNPSNTLSNYNDRVAEYINTRYFFSDYAMKNGKGGTTNFEATGKNDPHGAGYTVKGYFKFSNKSSDGVVQQVEIRIDPRSNTNSTDTYHNSKGLYVKIVTNSDGSTTTYAQNWDTRNLDVVSINDAEKLLK